LIVGVNAACYYLITCFIRDGKSPHPPVIQRVLVAGSTLAILAVCLGFGVSALHSSDQETPAPGAKLKIALAQGNIEQKLKWDPEYSRRIIQTYRDLTLKAAENKPDLIVWPEAATPFFFNLEQEDTESLKNLVRSIHIPLLFGSPYQENSPTGRILYNRAYFVNADGETTGSYDKIHLVPFGEFVPFRKMLWFVNKLVEMVGDFGRGEKAPVFTLKDRRFSVSICYEVTFPDLVRQPVKDGAEFLVNITNDAWYGRSAASYQHMSMVAMRAVENRVPIVRAANTGITGTIDASGRIRRATNLFVEDLVVAEIVPSRRGPSFYARNGDIFSQTCILASIVFALWIRTRRT
jgi:apolipoprotein N-acyltransferase